ncbi:MAG: O-antigen ligase family protein, partial [bacterium]
DLGPIPTNIFEIAIGLTSILGIIEFIKSRRKPELGGYWPYLLLLAALISVFVAPDKLNALGIFKGWFVVPFMLYLLMINFLEAKCIFKVSLILFVQLLFISLWAILQRIGIIPTLFYQVGDSSFNQYLVEGRAFGPFESPNFLAMYLAPVIFLSSLFIQQISSKLSRIIIILLFILPFTALYLSGSNGGILAILAALFLVLIFMTWSRNKQGKLIAIAFLLVGAVSLGIIFSKNDLNSGSNDIRREIYSYSKTMLEGHPVVGIGLGNFQNEIAQYSKDNGSFQMWGLPFALHPHNVYIAFWLNLGLLGIVSFLVLLVRFFANLNKIKTSFYRTLLLASMSTILVHGLFDTTYFKNDLSSIFWLILAVAYLAQEGKDED